MDSPEPAAAAAAAVDVAGTVRAATLMTVVSGVVAVGNLVFSVIVAHNGGAAAYGAVNSLLTIAGVAGLLTTGVQFAVARAVATESMRADEALRIGLRTTLPLMALAIALLAGSPLVARFLQLSNTVPAAEAAGMFAFMLILATPAGVLYGLCRFHVIAGVMVGGAALRLLLGGLLVGGDHALEGALLASLLALVATIAVSAIVAVSEVRSPRAQRYGRRRLAAEGAGGTLATVGIWILWAIPLLEARHALPANDAGNFAAAQSVAGGVTLLAGSCTLVFFPVIARHTSLRMALVGAIVTAALAVMCGVVLTVVGPLIVHRLYGPTFTIGSTLVGSMCAAAVILAILGHTLWAGRALRRLGPLIAEIIVVAIGVDVVLSVVAAHEAMLLGAAPGLSVLVAAALCGVRRLLSRIVTGRRRSSVVSADPAMHTSYAASPRRVMLLNWKDPCAPDAGGAERYVQRVAEIWASNGTEVTILVPRDARSERAHRCTGVEYLRVGNRHTVFGEARRHLREHGHHYDTIIESVSTRPFFAHECVGDRAWVLYHQIADDVWHQEFRFPVDVFGRRVLEPWWLRRMSSTTRVIAVSRSTAADLERHGVQAWAIVPPGCDANPLVPRRLSEGRDLMRLAFIGRLVRTKRPHDAVRAFHIVRTRHPHAVLDVIGDGYLRAAIEAGGGPGTTVHGWLDEERKRAVLGRADVLLVPGTREGWGIVAMEAAAHGVPVVAYDIPGLRDAVEHERTGVLVAPTPSALAAATIDLLEDPTRWALLSEAAHRRAANLTWQVTANRMAMAIWGTGQRSSTAA